jgi:hypothetical protein
MESRRLVVWIAVGILGFQGGTLSLDLLNCSVLSWLYVRRHGLQLASPAPNTVQGPPGGDPEQRPLPGATAGTYEQGAGAHSQAPGTSGSSQEPGARGSALGGIARSAQPLALSGVAPTGEAPSATSSAASQPTSSNSSSSSTTPAQAPFDPTAVFCDRPRSRVDAAVSQGLSILAGLALGGAGAGGGKEVP